MASAPPTAQASMSAKLLLHGDPLATPAVAVVLGFLEEAWRNFAGQNDQSSITLPALAAFWREAAPMAKRKLSQCRGPIQIAGWTLKSLGWKWLSPFAFQTHRGVTLEVAVNTPKAFKMWLLEAVADQHDHNLRKRALRTIPETNGELRAAFTNKEGD